MGPTPYDAEAAVKLDGDVVAELDAAARRALTSAAGDPAQGLDVRREGASPGRVSDTQVLTRPRPVGLLTFA